MTDDADRSTAGAVTVELPAQARFLRVARLVGSGLATDLDFDLDRLDDVRLAIGEVCALAVHAGAATLRVEYRVDGSQLIVDGTAPVTSTAGGIDGTSFVEQLVLVEQILGVACREHRVTRDGDSVSFRLAFEHER